jgi:hypothetical protein
MCSHCSAGGGARKERMQALKMLKIKSFKKIILIFILKFCWTKLTFFFAVDDLLLQRLGDHPAGEVSGDVEAVA